MTIYQAVGTLALPPDSLTVPEFILDDPKSPERVCFIEEITGRKVYFSELRLRTAYLSAALNELGRIHPGDIVALISPNHIDYPICVWALHRLGAVVALMNPGMTGDEMGHLLKLAHPKFLIAHPDSVGLVKEGAKHAGLNGYDVVTLSTNTTSNLGYTTTEALIARGKRLPPFTQRKLSPGEGKTSVAFLCFSSGTTGLPKAVSISHYNVISNVLQLTAAHGVYDPQVEWNAKRYRPGDVCSGFLPLFHAYGLNIQMHFILHAQMSIVLSPKFNFEKMLDNISRYKITNLMIVPPQAVLLCKHPAVPQYDLSSVRVCMVGAAPVSAELTENLLRVLPDIQLGQGWGMTECTSCGTAFPLTQKVGKLGSAGMLIPGTSAKVVKSDGSLARDGEQGELYLQGPQVVLGYYNNPTATKDTFVDGWLRTGDEAYFDAEGNMFLVDRVKELIKVKAHQVAPAELEGHLLTHNAVADTAVIGVPDDFAGELPFAFIVLKPETAAEVEQNRKKPAELKKSIFQHVAKAKTPYKWLEGGIEFVDVIPKSASGKILRRFLRDRIRDERAARSKL
ncbi:phenylacetyl-CoA ligase [Favolaschia claudopus]|uniref:Phenylacetyl-CoA ligase n=1 Tax=Favolaschia claudopus TaxID=2862362 RepID=A0AAW0CMP1_9AGAR